MVRLRFDVHGETQIDRELVRWTDSFTDASPAFAMIYNFLLRVEKLQFDTQGGASGHPWPALKAGTVEEKLRKGLRPEILRATDELMLSLTSEGDSNQLHEVGPSWLAFGSNLPYATAHQSGTDHIPQRRPVDLTEANKVAIAKSLQLWIARGVAPEIAFGGNIDTGSKNVTMS